MYIVCVEKYENIHIFELHNAMGAISRKYILTEIPPPHAGHDRFSKRHGVRMHGKNKKIFTSLFIEFVRNAIFSDSLQKYAILQLKPDAEIKMVKL